MRSVPSDTPVSRATSLMVKTGSTPLRGQRLHVLARAPETEPDAALRGAERHLLDPRDLARREAAAVGEQEGVALVARERLEHAQQALRALAADHRLGGVLGRLRDGALLLLGALDGVLAGTAGAPAVERAAAGEHRHVTRERAARGVVGAGLQPELHEHILNDILGGGLVAEHAVGRCER